METLFYHAYRLGVKSVFICLLSNLSLLEDD